MSNITKIYEINEVDEDKELHAVVHEYLQINRLEDPDFLLIKPEKKESIGIEEVKELRKWIYTRPYLKKIKLLVILKGDVLTHEAQNSILKITEEPPTFSQIVIFVTNHRNLLQTLVSRSDIISKKKDSENIVSDEVKTFISSDLSSKFKLMEALSKKTKKDIHNFIDNLIFYLKSKNAFSIIQKMIKLKEAIESNVNKKLVLDNIVILSKDLN